MSAADKVLEDLCSIIPDKAAGDNRQACVWERKNLKLVASFGASIQKSINPVGVANAPMGKTQNRKNDMSFARVRSDDKPIPIVYYNHV